jgi:hypothetical protein
MFLRPGGNERRWSKKILVPPDYERFSETLFSYHMFMNVSPNCFNKKRKYLCRKSDLEGRGEDLATMWTRQEAKTLLVTIEPFRTGEIQRLFVRNG